MSLDGRVRVSAMLAAGALLLGGAAALAPTLSGGSASNPSSAPVTRYDTGSTVTSAAVTPTVRKVAMVRCTSYRYVTRTRATTCLKGTRVTTTARFLGSIVQTRGTTGAWTRVAYVWDPRARLLVYSRWLDLQLHKKVVADPQGLPGPGPAPRPTATPTPTVTPTPVPVAVPVAAVPAPSTIPQPDGVAVSPTPWLDVPGDAAQKAGAYSYFPASAAAPNAAHWDRCTPITWTVDLTRASQAGTTADYELARWQQIIDYASRVTGYTFTYVPGDGKVTIDPATNQPVASAWTGTGAQLVITYVSPDDPGAYRSAAVGGGVVGRAGPWYSTLPGGVLQIFKAYVQLDYDWLPTASETDHYDLMFHEFGHALGLAHVNDPTQVMNPYIDEQDTYRLGDRTGLWQLGQDTCIASGS